MVMFRDPAGQTSTLRGPQPFHKAAPDTAGTYIVRRTAAAWGVFRAGERGRSECLATPEPLAYFAAEADAEDLARRLADGQRKPAAAANGAAVSGKPLKGKRRGGRKLSTVHKNTTFRRLNMGAPTHAY